VREEDPDEEESQGTEPTTSRMSATGDAFVTFKDAYDAVSAHCPVSILSLLTLLCNP
jgi:hypothetical protein